MNTEIQLSVIIPVYNVEAYIGKCLDSVIQQTGVNFEIICINDGSLDNSKTIIQQYIDYHPYVRCIDQENAGLSAARNTGIRAAKGEYVVLLDSDDWLEEDVLSSLYEQAKSAALDVLVGNIKWIYPDRTHVERINNGLLIKDIHCGRDVLVAMMYEEVYVPMAYNLICSTAFIRKFDLYFKEGLIYEDELWTPQVLLAAQRVSTSLLYHYNYLQRENTITTSTGSLKKVESFFYVSNQLITFGNKQESVLLKEQFWIRACILYFRGKNMQKELSLPSTYVISGIRLMMAGLSRKGFDKCLGFIHLTLMERRILRVIYKCLKG